MIPQQNLEVRRAAVDDFETVQSILEEAATWLVSRGIRQWTPEEIRQGAGWHRQAIEDGNMYLTMVNGDAYGTFMFIWSDPLFWGEMANDAGYVHRLAIRRAYAGQGLGLQMLRWAEDAARDAGKRYLRLDCAGHNSGLIRYYECAGYRNLGPKQVKEWTVNLFEKDLLSS